MDTTDDTQKLIQSANDLVARIQADHESTESFYRAENLDPDKVRDVLDAALNDETRARAQAEFQADLDAIEQEVAEEAARLSFAARDTGPASPHAPDINMMV